MLLLGLDSRLMEIFIDYGNFVTNQRLAGGFEPTNMTTL